MRLHRGVHRELEDEADRILAEYHRTVTRPEDKKDILTPWKEQDRRSHEIFVRDGVPDRASRNGIFHRAVNPEHKWLNSATPASRAIRRRSIADAQGGWQ